MDSFSEGDQVRRVTSRQALGDDFTGPARQHGKKIATVQRVYEENGDEVCDLAYSDGEEETGVAVSDLEPAEQNVT